MRKPNGGTQGQDRAPEVDRSESTVKLGEDKGAALAQTLNQRRSRIRTSSWSNENKARVTRAERSLRLYLKGGHRPALVVCDMLSDLRHYCDAYGLSYLKQDEIACRNYVGQVLELI